MRQFGDLLNELFTLVTLRHITPIKLNVALQRQAGSQCSQLHLVVLHRLHIEHGAAQSQRCLSAVADDLDGG